MSLNRIRRKHLFNGSLADYTSLKLSDPTGTYGLRRESDSVVLVFDNTSFIRDSIGTYHFDVELDPGIYDYWVERVFDGETHWDQTILTVLAAPVPTSRFFTYDKFIRRWGLKNVAVASNKDAKILDPDFNSVQDSFSYADDEVEAKLSGGVLESPLDFSPNGNEVPPRVQEWAMTIAFENLYNARGYDDNDKKGARLLVQLRRVKTAMVMYRGGLRQMREAKYATDSSMAASAITRRSVLLARDFIIWRDPDQQPFFV